MKRKALSVLFAFTLMSGIDSAVKQDLSTPVVVNVSAKKKKKAKNYFRHIFLQQLRLPHYKKAAKHRLKLLES